MTASPNKSATLGEAAANGEDNPWPVKTVAMKIAGWIDRLGAVWITGQIAELSARHGARAAFVTLRDTAENASLQIMCPMGLLKGNPEIKEGAEVVVHGKLSFYTARGTLAIWADTIRAVGVGELLARIERLRKQFAAEGLSDPRRKRPLPFLPGGVGLITGRASAAQQDVLSIAKARWPQVRFHLREVAVQGPGSAQAVIAALKELQASSEVEVIVLARGGGSVEDLLTFSEESLCRAVAACPVPVVSAIGHETDRPLSDDVADVRAATPTDAAKRVVPDVAVERSRLHEMRGRSAAALRGWVEREQARIASLAARPALSDPHAMLRARAEGLRGARDTLRRSVQRQIEHERHAVAASAARLAALGPAATLARGYALVQGADGELVRDPAQTKPGDRLRIRLADGLLGAMTTKEIP
ncbi:exodeoxyribonuclease VII, large subunit [Segniliparus rotundus DSM 44985]|uniref:Exodeoxyribonuclease 7 large subunit n=1 Tax=Segniliparus rotundus (strain ATCC BAA-972 / CDC 1076 / CIP 108378 / DSM 44985 / JCM 13578) TaxID=640132 RepID=D6ZF37_SEGRD|nr:exodeoxyribonuclease VII large subunit [Segniliparus rotundus]ADG97561.1 exodeoxyribonuclease VII, large subunit [Segniliparus rotundus DSM 44985]